MGYKPRTCTVCDTEFYPTGSKQETCSRSCGQRLRACKAGKMPGMRRVCEVCGTTYRYSYSKQRTCGRACGAELVRREGRFNRPEPRPRTKWPISRVYFPECIQCGAVFIARNARVGLCSNACRIARSVASRPTYWARDKRRLPADFIRQCTCGVVIDRCRQKCDTCIELNRRASRQRRKRADRARKRGIKSESYTLVEIAERDRFKCGLCRGKVAMNRAVPHPKAPTIDHVLPVAVGGDDTRANVQLAHFLCNSMKGTRGSQQLALIG